MHCPGFFRIPMHINSNAESELNHLTKFVRKESVNNVNRIVLYRKFLNQNKIFSFAELFQTERKYTIHMRCMP